VSLSPKLQAASVGGLRGTCAAGCVGYRWGAHLFTYRIDQTQRLVTVEATGKVSIAEALDVQRRIRTEPTFDPAYAMLADYRAADLSDFDAAALRRNAENTPFLPVSPRAYVAGDDLGFGILRMFEIYNEHGKHGMRIKVFRDMDSALQWIRGL
jgi:hypothetical protein